MNQAAELCAGALATTGLPETLSCFLHLLPPIVGAFGPRPALRALLRAMAMVCFLALAAPNFLLVEFTTAGGFNFNSEKIADIFPSSAIYRITELIITHMSNLQTNGQYLNDIGVGSLDI